MGMADAEMEMKWAGGRLDVGREVAGCDAVKKVRKEVSRV